MATKQLQEGVIYQVNEIVPLHHANNEYVENSFVIPDGEKYVKVKCTAGVFAFNKEQFEDELKLAKNTSNKNEYIHCYYSDYIQGNDERGARKYFTCEEAARMNDFDFSARLNRWHDKKCSQFYGDETLMGYHDRRVMGSENNPHLQIPRFVNDSDEFMFGVEVEKCDYEVREEQKAFELFQATGWKKESDGSLNSGGYELVSPVMPLMDMSRIERACSPVTRYINAKSDSSCGGHFNLSQRNVPSRTFLQNMKGFAPIIYALYETRLDNRYCRARNWNHYFSNPDKYSAFYLKSDNIVEIRLFSRITNYKVMLWRVKLMQTLLADLGRNLNQFVLKMSSPENKLYQLLTEQYNRDTIKKKIKLVDVYSQRYNCGKISNSVRTKVNERFGEIVLPLI
jgi:hypothetical protein